MARPESIGIVKHISLGELNKEIEGAEKSIATVSRVSQRLTFIRMRYLGYSVPESARAVGISEPTGYSIQRSWNEGGPAAIVPRFGGGRTSRMTDGQKEELVELLRVNPLETNDVRLLIKELYGVEYTNKQVHVILTKLKLHHAKPYPRDHRRPDDAEGILKKDSNMLWTVPETMS